MNKPRPTNEEFAELKRKRAEATEAKVQAICDEHGWNRDEMLAHVSGSHGCCCACPDGPCQHIWDGPYYEEENMVSVTCSLCGAPAIYHDMRVMP